MPCRIRTIWNSFFARGQVFDMEHIEQRLQAGEFFVLEGPGGSGKSVVTKLLAKRCTARGVLCLRVPVSQLAQVCHETKDKAGVAESAKPAGSFASTQSDTEERRWRELLVLWAVKRFGEAANSLAQPKDPMILILDGLEDTFCFSKPLRTKNLGIWNLFISMLVGSLFKPPCIKEAGAELDSILAWLRFQVRNRKVLGIFRGILITLRPAGRITCQAELNCLKALGAGEVCNEVLFGLRSFSMHLPGKPLQPRVHLPLHRAAFSDGCGQRGAEYRPGLARGCRSRRQGPECRDLSICRYCSSTSLSL